MFLTKLPHMTDVLAGKLICASKTHHNSSWVISFLVHDWLMGPWVISKTSFSHHQVPLHKRKSQEAEFALPRPRPPRPRPLALAFG